MAGFLISSIEFTMQTSCRSYLLQLSQMMLVHNGQSVESEFLDVVESG